MEKEKKYRYSDFWEMRGRQTIWLTRNVSYRLGSVIALISSRVGITPNIISILSASITVVSAIIAVYLGQGNWVAGAVLLVGLQIGYAFDCADGPLARATGQGSSFGALSDKLADLSSGMLLPCVLVYGVSPFVINWQGGHWDLTLAVTALFLTVRASLAVLMWLKELVIYKADRLQEDSRERNLWWKLKKIVSLCIDEPIYRFLIAVAWMFGFFWEFMILYGGGVLMITLLYVLSSMKEMDAMDRKKSRSREKVE